MSSFLIQVDSFIEFSLETLRNPKFRAWVWGFGDGYLLPSQTDLQPVKAHEAYVHLLSKWITDFYQVSALKQANGKLGASLKS